MGLLPHVLLRRPTSVGRVWDHNQQLWISAYGALPTSAHKQQLWGVALGDGSAEFYNQQLWISAYWALPTSAHKQQLWDVALGDGSAPFYNQQW